MVFQSTVVLSLKKRLSLSIRVMDKKEEVNSLQEIKKKKIEIICEK